jgi:hypothetical protein
MPTQGRGAIDGLEWYFRARGGQWYFAVAVPPLIAVETHRLSPPGAFMLEGEGEPYPEEAWVLIEDSMKSFRIREGRPWSPALRFPYVEDNPSTA